MSDAPQTPDSAPNSAHAEHPSFERESISPRDFEEGFNRLATNYIVFERRTGYIASLVVGCLLILASSPVLVYSLVTGRTWLTILVLAGWPAVGMLLGFSAHFWPPLKYRHICWRLNDWGLEIRRGVWWRHRIAVPLARVQHVDVSQGPVQRMFDLGTLTVYTAGTKHSSVELEGLEHSLALRLRDELILQKESLDVL